MRTVRWKTAIVIAIVAALVAGVALAAGPRGGRGRGARRGPGMEPGGPGQFGGRPEWGPIGPGGPGMGGGYPNARQGVWRPRGMRGGPGMQRGPGVGMGPVWMLRGLDLTAEQIDAVKEIMEANKEAMQASHEAVAEARKALEEAVVAGADEQDIRAAAAALSKAIGDGAVLRASTAASVKKVLTEEQLAELEERKERAEGFRERIQDPEFRGRLGRIRGGRPGGLGDRRGVRGPTLGPGIGPWPGGGRGLDIKTLFENRDADDDGKLTKEELKADDDRPHLGLDRLFEKADTDNDGALTVEELEAFKDTMGQRLGRRRPLW